ncbi:MAG: Arc family DNA-binding protein [Mesorhizobium sp.]
MATPKQTDPQFKLRFTPELRDQIEASAKTNNRSMNAEIVARLEDYPRISLLATALTRADQVERELRSEIETLRKEVREHAGRASVYEKRLMVSDAERARLEKQNRHYQRTNESFAELLKNAGDLSDKVAAAEAKAAKMENFLRQARTRLGTIREERDELARFVKLASEGVEKDFMGWQKVADLSDREILLRLLLEISRLSSEITIGRSREREEIERLINEMGDQNVHVEESYLSGQTSNIDPDTDLIVPETPLGNLLSDVVGRRTELAMRTIVNELEKNGMLAGSEQPSHRPTAEEWNELRAAPRELQGEILEALANVEIDRALEIARQQTKKGAA